MVPSATAVRLFAAQLTKANTTEQLLAAYHARLSAAGLVLNEGTIIDASIVHASVQHNSREENDQLKKEGVPTDRSAP